jgi:LPS export ABC transporter protein LptC
MKYSLGLLVALLFMACSFEYPSASGEESTLPDIVMERLEYMRVRKGTPQARFKAERAERYNGRSLMMLSEIEFEQFNHLGETDTEGTAGEAEVELQSGNIRLRGGVNVRVESEDMNLETGTLDWSDSEKLMKGGDTEVVVITRTDGTEFRGIALTVNTRNRHWDFASGGEGIYQQEDDEPEDDGVEVPDFMDVDDSWIEVEDEE